jgi:hypothetical protein
LSRTNPVVGRSARTFSVRASTTATPLAWLTASRGLGPCASAVGAGAEGVALSAVAPVGVGVAQAARAPARSGRRTKGVVRRLMRE